MCVGIFRHEAGIMFVLFLNIRLIGGFQAVSRSHQLGRGRIAPNANPSWPGAPALRRDLCERPPDSAPRNFVNAQAGTLEQQGVHRDQGRTARHRQGGHLGAEGDRIEHAGGQRKGDRLAKTFDVSDRLVIGHGRRSRGEICSDFADACPGPQMFFDDQRIERRSKAGHINGCGSHEGFSNRNRALTVPVRPPAWATANVSRYLAEAGSDT